MGRALLSHSRESSAVLYLYKNGGFFLQRRLRPLFPLLHDISQELAIDILILEESCMKKRILSLLLAAVMLLSLLPAGVLAAEDGKVRVTLSGLHSAQVNSLQLYTYTNGQKGTDNLLP